MALCQKHLSIWNFALGDSPDCLSHANKIHIPHTWNSRKYSENYVGKGWYQTTLTPGFLPEGAKSCLVFHGAYRDTEVYVNGVLCGQHFGSGYTPFTVDITPALRLHEENEILVSVDNRFSTDALPYDRSFDWANDGGLIRPVDFMATGPASLRDTEITAMPDFVVREAPACRCSALFLPDKNGFLHPRLHAALGPVPRGHRQHHAQGV